MAAIATDWKTHPLPEQRMRFTLDRVFSRPEMERIRNGLVPVQMEDKWFIYSEDDTLYFHRSWTGYCIYVARFVEVGEGSCRIAEVAVNGDASQYHAKDAAQEAGHINYLIDLLLLQSNPSYDHAPGSGMQSAAMAWSDVGRAYIGILPSEGDK